MKNKLIKWNCRRLKKL